MIYASDIDRTLIFSERFIEQFGVDRSQLRLIDECKTNSYISCKVADKLSHLTKLTKRIRFIPVTTRSTEQFKRIRFADYNIDIEYVITANGGTVLFKGHRLKEWEDYLKDKMPTDVEFRQVVESINSINHIEYGTKLIDGKYVFSRSANIPEHIAFVKNELSRLEKIFHQFKFSMYGNKVYAIPICFGKDITLNWLKHYLNEDRIISSGDSSFDIPMIGISDFQVIPGHSSIEDEELKNLSVRYVSSGIDSAIETMDIALENI